MRLAQNISRYAHTQGTLPILDQKAEPSLSGPSASWTSPGGERSSLLDYTNPCGESLDVGGGGEVGIPPAESNGLANSHIPLVLHNHG